VTTVNFLSSDGSIKNSIDGSDGESVMLTARGGGLTGIVGECGGVLSCATCHVLVDPAWSDRLPERSEDEEYLLEGTATPATESSRLSCQILLDPTLDGLTVTIPEEQ
jgi:2Fe-2S ferredoxin